MKSPNMLQSKLGQLSTFFFLYMSEGLPQGFAKVAVVTEMVKQGMGPRVTSTFVAVAFLPWAWKWAIGPVVDVFYSDRLGRRRMWIVGAQAMMLVTLMACMPVSFTTEIKLFTLLLVIHNIFAATQDVAIDALACSVLKEDDRGLANGLMFAGAHTGYIIGGSGALFLAQIVDFNWTYLFVGGCLLAITLFVSLRLREPRTAKAETPTEGSRLARASGEIKDYVREALRAVFATRAAFVGLIFALLPAGAMALDLPLQQNLAVELGMSRANIGTLTLVHGIIWVAACIIGGVLSDRLGRKRMLALYCLGTAIPTIFMALVLARYGWIMPVNPQMSNPPVAPGALLTAFLAMVIIHGVFVGLMYGTRTALFMDITTPAVAATQFTAYMALINLTTSYTAAWQGFAVEKWGYPVTLTIDSCVGMLCILLLPLMARPRSDK